MNYKNFSRKPTLNIYKFLYSDTASDMRVACRDSNGEGVRERMALEYIYTVVMRVFNDNNSCITNVF